MQEIRLNHAFVRNLTKGIRDAYGKEVRHSDVLKVIATAAGQKAGPMMHRLKHMDEQSGPGLQLGATTTFNGNLVWQMMTALRVGDTDTLTTLRRLIDPATSFAKFLLALACYRTMSPGNAYLIAAFLQDELWLRYVAAAIAGPYPIEELSEFGREEYGEHWPAEMISGGIPQPLLTWAALMAVEYGFLRFDGRDTVFLRPAVNDLKGKLKDLEHLLEGLA